MQKRNRFPTPLQAAIKLFLCVHCCLLAINTLAQCSPQDYNNRFTSLTNGAVIYDSHTGLYWSRCLLGEQWDNHLEQCSEGTGNTWNWTQALHTATLANYAGVAGWRVANAKELESLVIRTCTNPAIAQTVFKGQSELASQTQWSSTQVADYGVGAWTVNFGTGSVISIDKNVTLPVRLVRHKSP